MGSTRQTSPVRWCGSLCCLLLACPTALPSTPSSASPDDFARCVESLTSLEARLHAEAARLAEAGTCQRHQDCAAVDVSLSCLRTCPAVVPAAARARLHAFTRTVESQACARPPTCRAQPTCARTEARCHRGRCLPHWPDVEPLPEAEVSRRGPALAGLRDGGVG